ncbi:MAG: DUF4827 domain-containing protein [Prevotellaceae bacterium]|jgi:hypothetical protein|nr:DUF4827 domain-containing protein [Prevotellaceae bacterium]
MKKTIFFALITCIIFGFSCKKGKSLSEKRAEERAAIAKFIADSAYVVVDELPADTLFAEKVYYHSSTGLYLNIENKGESRKPKVNDKVYFRFYMRDLSGNIITRAMTPEESRDASSTKFGSGDIPAGLSEAIGYLGTDGAAYAIVPSSIGSTDAKSNITPYVYEIRYIKVE